MADICLVIPPFTQLNTTYPSITYLHRFIKQHGYTAHLLDASITVAVQIFSRTGLQEIFENIEQQLEDGAEYPEEVWLLVARKQRILSIIDSVISFLQGKDNTLHAKIFAGGFLPETPRLAMVSLEHFGSMGAYDGSKYLCTLFIEDIADLLKCCVDIGFDFGKYQAHLATGSVLFEPIIERLEQTTLIDAYIDAVTDTIATSCVAISIPFAGTVYAALRMGKRLRQRGIAVWFGGGYVNTELRDMNDIRIWDYCDALCYDAGEEPLLHLLHRHYNKDHHLIRTKTKEGYFHSPTHSHNPFVPIGDYGDLPLGQYLQLLDTLSPAHRMWSDGRWNKFTLAHGCYWKKCSFCDIHVDYISRYVPASIVELVDQIEEVIAQTGNTGFHFVDEAAPPKMLREFALEILKRDIQISFWGNIRFEKAYTPDLCQLLAKAGLSMVTGGLEVAENRLLQKMRKGVTVEQAIHCTKAFQDAGILVHAYLMYGFPSQTTQETLNSMEMVRQLFAANLLDSAFWHRFVLTKHSDVYANPKEYAVEILHPSAEVFATNDIEHRDLKGDNHDIFDDVLPYALNLWMRGEDLDTPIYRFFDRKMPKITVSSNFVSMHIQQYNKKEIQDNTVLLWLGQSIMETETGLLFVDNHATLEIEMSVAHCAWLGQKLEQCTIQHMGMEYSVFAQDMPAKMPLKKWLHQLRTVGLCVL